MEKEIYTEDIGYGFKKKCRKTLSRLLSTDSDESPRNEKFSTGSSDDGAMSCEQQSPKNKPSPRSKKSSPRDVRMRKISVETNDTTHLSAQELKVSSRSRSVSEALPKKVHTDAFTNSQSSLSIDTTFIRNSGFTPLDMSPSTPPLSIRDGFDVKNTRNNDKERNGSNQRLEPFSSARGTGSDQISEPVGSACGTDPFSVDTSRLLYPRGVPIPENKSKCFIVTLVRPEDLQDGVLNIRAIGYDTFYLVQTGYHGATIIEEGDQYYLVYSRTKFIVPDPMYIPESNKFTCVNTDDATDTQKHALEQGLFCCSEEKIIEIFRRNFPIIVKSKLYVFDEENFKSVFLELMSVINKNTADTQNV